MPIKPRDYQEKAAQHAIQMIGERKNSLIVAATGAGKTIMMSDIIDRFSTGFQAMHRRKPHILSLVHRNEIHKQNYKKFSMVCPHIQTSEVTALVKSFKGFVHFAMVQTMVGMLKELEHTDNFFDLIVVDECFTADTLIDGRPISEIQVGDMVNSYNHTTCQIEQKKVVRLFKNKPTTIMSVVSNGEKITCTENHPFYVMGKGYVSANSLKEGDYIAKIHLHNMSKGSKHASVYAKTNKPQEKKIRNNWTNILWQRMCRFLQIENKQRDNGEYKQKICFSKNETEKSNAQQRFGRKDEKYPKENRASSDNTRRKRARFDCPTTKLAKFFRRIWGSRRVCSKNEEGIKHFFAQSLQDRYCNSRTSFGDRSRRRKSLCVKDKRKRQEKRMFLKWQRVDGIEIYKQASNGRFGNLQNDGYVYNFEVEDNHNYFANGILVHNCHHTVAETYERIIEWNKIRNPNACILGVTATPERGDEQPLIDHFDNYYQITTKYLLDCHYLVRPDFYDLSPKFKKLKEQKAKKGKVAPPPKLIEETGYLNRNVNLNEKEGQDLVAQLCREYLMRKQDGKTVIFAPSHEWCLAINEQLQKLGRKTAYLYANIDDVTRAEEIDKFENGEADELINVDICTEGYDFPPLRNLVEFDTNGTHGQWVQKVGRVLRTAEGKTSCSVIDFGGNILLYPQGVEIDVNLTDGEFKNPKGQGLSNEDFFADREEKDKTTSAYTLEAPTLFTPYHLPVGFETVNDKDFGIVWVSCGAKKDTIIVDLDGECHLYCGDKKNLHKDGIYGFNKAIQRGLEWVEAPLVNSDPITRIQIKMLAPEYPTMTLTQSGANCTICWKVWKEKITEDLK